MILQDPGCPAVAGFNQPHDFEEWPRASNSYRSLLFCQWRVMWGPKEVVLGEPHIYYRSPIKGYTYECRHYLRCARCWTQVPVPPRLCPDWMDRPIRFSVRNDWYY